MKEIKAYVHRNRIAAVISALKASDACSAAESGDHNLTVYMVKGSLLPLEGGERRYSLDLGDAVINGTSSSFIALTPTSPISCR